MIPAHCLRFRIYKVKSVNVAVVDRKISSSCLLVLSLHSYMCFVPHPPHCSCYFPAASEEWSFPRRQALSSEKGQERAGDSGGDDLLQAQKGIVITGKLENEEAGVRGEGLRGMAH